MIRYPAKVLTEDQVSSLCEIKHWEGIYCSLEYARLLAKPFEDEKSCFWPKFVLPDTETENGIKDGVMILDVLTFIVSKCAPEIRVPQLDTEDCDSRHDDIRWDAMVKLRNVLIALFEECYGAF